MIIYHKIEKLKSFAHSNPGLWSNSGFVPTMGALHAGHISLVKSAKDISKITVVSIFVNPSQFNDPEDFKKYPVTIDRDIQLLEEAGCDILFLPTADEIYPHGWGGDEHYDLSTLETLLEGHYRPGHFQGVCGVVHRLLDIVRPATIFMGQKDFQQCMVVQRLIGLKNHPVQLYTCPTLREPDGLAMSSRNVRLNAEERQKATGIYQEMQQIKAELETMPLRKLEERASQNLLASGFKSVDYVSIAQPETLSPLENWQPGTPSVVLIAAFLGEVRLIDNMVLD